MRKSNPRRNKNRKRRRRAGTITLFIILAVGVGVLVYPTFSDAWNRRTQTRAIAAYDDAVDNMTEQDLSEYWAAAEAYNEALYELGSSRAISHPELLEDQYYAALDVSGTGIMGYVTIDRINVQLPIYHGTEATVLQVGAGHLEGTSLPIGEENAHAVISAHRGLPSAKLFTDLDKLEVGDTFTISVLNEIFTYEVDQIAIVLPTEIEDLYIKPGEDYVTLMTCTPYAVNSHRLLVRGTRIDSLDQVRIKVDGEADRIQPLLVAVFIGIPMIITAIIALVVFSNHRRKKQAAAKSDPAGVAPPDGSEAIPEAEAGAEAANYEGRHTAEFKPPIDNTENYSGAHLPVDDSMPAGDAAIRAEIKAEQDYTGMYVDDQVRAAKQAAEAWNRARHDKNAGG